MQLLGQCDYRFHVFCFIARHSPSWLLLSSIVGWEWQNNSSAPLTFWWLCKATLDRKLSWEMRQTIDKVVVRSVGDERHPIAG
jgi:hypothetical protein